MSKTVRRLLDQFVPENYNLELDIDRANMSFSGKVIIRGKKVGRPSKRITFHQKDLKIESATLTRYDKSDEKLIKVVRINSHQTFNEVRLHSEELIYPGSYTIEIKFSANITEPMMGLYPCRYDQNGDTKYLLATQFESHHAREAFPCIDEPSAKATFDLTLITQVGDTVLSNTSEKGTPKTANGRKTTVFETTPIMSSYLLAFVIGDMVSVEGKTKRGITVRSWAHVGQPKSSLKYANEKAIKILDFFEEYFDTPFPLAKCDQVALPDFEAGAMENWGLITYREVALLTDQENRSLSSEQYVSMVIGHEMSHQWFGDLVTMRWWDDLWLNESFASLMEHVALDHLHPDWHQWETYVSSDVLACSNRDIYKDVQPVRVEVNHPDEIHTLFDPAIVYAKGGRLLKMLLDYIGEDAFKEGLKSYFDQHKYANTSKDDLWATLSASSGKNINAFMDPWLEQSGMPVILVENCKNNIVSLSQSRFVLDETKSELKWPVPLLANEGVKPDIFTDKRTDITFSSDEPPLFNIHGSGHYIVNYQGESRKRIAKAIHDLSISSEARINSLNDLLLLDKRGDIKMTDILDVVSQCSDEPRDAVWSLIARVLGLAATIGEQDIQIEKGIKSLKYRLVHKQHQKLGWDQQKSDEPNTTLLRTTLISMMIGSEDKDTINEAINRYDTSKSINDLPSELRGVILGAVVRHRGNQEDINQLIDQYKSSNDPNIQLSIAGALTHSKDIAVIKRLLSEGLGSDSFVRPQDMFRWYAYLMRNKHSRELTWEWFTTSWNRLEELFGGGKSFDHFIAFSAGPIQTNDWGEKFNNFFEPKKDIIALSRNISIAQSEIDARIAWHDRNFADLKKYLS